MHPFHAAFLEAHNDDPPYVTENRLGGMTELTKADFKNSEFIQPKGSVIGLAVAILLKL